MATTVGGISCDLIQGQFPVKTQMTQTWQMPGVDGYGARVMGLGQSEFRIRVIHHETYANLLAWYALLAAKVGALITVVDAAGTTTAGVLIKQMSPVAISAARMAKPGVVTDCCMGVVEIEGVVT